LLDLEVLAEFQKQLLGLRRRLIGRFPLAVNPANTRLIALKLDAQGTGSRK
jgi:hypothetical protein